MFRFSLLLGAFVCGCAPRIVFAGMPSVRLSEVAALRLSAISFFLLVLLISSIVVQKIWNGMRRDWEWLPTSIRR